ncbi:MAG: threonine synthase [Candidatus Bathyarchaeota archaeon]|nr:threonine synthase [Candidatus Bathyarchaeota archaeon]MCX8177679.1 threonine synthase [Candidatus Bathyarchaeota archaeon]MDW8193933.1 threonine synthase [Nitrososphaerota archaeon]
MEVFKLEGSYVKALRCRECRKEFPPTKVYACIHCFGPLEVVYDVDSINLSKASFDSRPRTIWRYRELLPINDWKKIVDLKAGYTPLRKCDRLARALGLKTLYIKDDTVNPTGSFKDRPAAVAVSKALEFYVEAVGCASTGNLAAAVAAHAAKVGLPCYVFIPSNTEVNKIAQAATYGANIVAVEGTYDEVNRLALQAAETFNWAFANINIRPYYVEGSKTLAFEICEQLGWKAPDHIIVPTASGALLCAINRGLKQFNELELISDENTRLTAAQPEGCSPIVKAFKSGKDSVEPVEKPQTVARSLAIGDPADGVYALKAVRQSGGVAESASDDEIISAIKLLGKTEGIFAEPAGGVAVAVLKKLAESGKVSADDEVVCCVTGSGFKASEHILEGAPKFEVIEPNLKALERLVVKLRK